ncbi:MAG TPA: J domain-containing protein [Acidobacteriota bacterium]
MAVKFRDYYEVLGVDRKASAAEIRKAYRRLARKYHPDVNRDDKQAEDRFKEIGEAHAVLSDPDKRRKYDQLGPTWRHGADFTPPPDFDFRTVFGGQRPSGGGFSGMSDFFEMLFGGLGGGRGAARGGAGRIDPFGFEGFGAEVETAEPVAESEITINLEDAYHGATRPISIERAAPCARCGGRDRRCPDCRGSGLVSERRTLQVKIPAGVTDGGRIRLAGQGEIGPRGRRGDLHLRVRYAAHPLFQVEGADLITELRVAPWEAILGAQVTVRTLDGPIRVQLPPGSSSGRRIRLRQRGMPQRSGRGDLYAVVKVVLPEHPSPRELELMREWAKLSSFNPRP